MIPWLHEGDLHFPDPATALDEPNGLLAAGGDLTPARLIAAYRRGIFPWYSEGEPILWWSPDPRCIIRPDRVHISRSLRRAMRRTPCQTSYDRAFAAVIDACAAPRSGQDGTWITPEIREAYLRLHQLGYAHSVEVWQDDALIGGVYGVALGRVFFGESMFSRATNGSKIALVELCRRLHQNGYVLLDCQIYNPHLERMGAELISRRQFTDQLRRHAAPEVADHWNLEKTALP